MTLDELFTVSLLALNRWVRQSQDTPGHDLRIRLDYLNPLPCSIYGRPRRRRFLGSVEQTFSNMRKLRRIVSPINWPPSTRSLRHSQSHYIQSLLNIAQFAPRDDFDESNIDYWPSINHSCVKSTDGQLRYFISIADNFPINNSRHINGSQNNETRKITYSNASARLIFIACARFTPSRLLSFTGSCSTGPAPG